MSLTPSNDSPLVRTDYDPKLDSAWARFLTTVATENADGFRAYVQPVSDSAWDGARPRQLRDAAKGVNALVMFAADGTTLSDPSFPVLVIEIDPDEATAANEADSQAEEDTHHTSKDNQPVATLSRCEPRTFRCIARELWSVENNLNLANMNWEDFTAALQDGVYRGFPEPDRDIVPQGGGVDSEGGQLPPLKLATKARTVER